MSEISQWALNLIILYWSIIFGISELLGFSFKSCFKPAMTWCLFRGRTNCLPIVLHENIHNVINFWSFWVIWFCLVDISNLSSFWGWLESTEQRQMSRYTSVRTHTIDICGNKVSIIGIILLEYKRASNAVHLKIINILSGPSILCVLLCWNALLLHNLC